MKVRAENGIGSALLLVAAKDCGIEADGKDVESGMALPISITRLPLSLRF